MGDLIPVISWPDFRTIADAGKLSELKSCQVFFGDEHKFNAVIFHGSRFGMEGPITQSEVWGQRTNIVGGKDPQELLAAIEEEKQCLSLSSVAKTDVGDLKPSVNTRKSTKSGARRAKGKRKGSTRRLALASAGG